MKRLLLIVGLLPLLCFGQANTYRDISWLINRNTPAAGGGGGATTNTWVTSVGFAQGFEGNGGNVGNGRGVKITVGASNITVTDLAAWAFADGVQTTVIVQIYDASCNAITGATASPNIGANDGAFHFAAITTPTVLTAGTVYFVMSTQYVFWTDALLTTTSAATANDTVENPCTLDGVGTGHGSGPVNFKYTIP